MREWWAWRMRSGMMGVAPVTKADEGAKILFDFLSMIVRSSNQIGSRPCYRTALEASTSPEPPSANVFGKGYGGGGGRNWREPPRHHPHHCWMGCSMSQLRRRPGGGGNSIVQGDCRPCCSGEEMRGPQCRGFSCRPHRLTLILFQEGWDLIANDLTMWGLMVVETPCKSSTQSWTHLHTELLFFNWHWTTVLVKHDAY
jgi:hypothetical protein